jgi:hypothetical protein
MMQLMTQLQINFVFNPTIELALGSDLFSACACFHQVMVAA